MPGTLIAPALFCPLSFRDIRVIGNRAYQGGGHVGLCPLASLRVEVIAQAGRREPRAPTVSHAQVLQGLARGGSYSLATTPSSRRLLPVTGCVGPPRQPLQAILPQPCGGSKRVDGARQLEVRI